MSLQDPISDMLVRIKNAQAVSKKTVSMPSSKHKLSILKVLQDEGYIGEISVTDDVKPVLSVGLKYYSDKPVIETLKRISRPGLRIYKNASQLPVVKAGLGVAIISTCRGVMSAQNARSQNLGGELLCIVD